MFKYRLYTLDGDELGDATYAVAIAPGQCVYIGSGTRLRVLDVIPFEDSGSDYAGMLKVERTPAAGWFCDCWGPDGDDPAFALGVPITRLKAERLRGQGGSASPFARQEAAKPDPGEVVGAWLRPGARKRLEQAPRDGRILVPPRGSGHRCSCGNPGA